MAIAHTKFLGWQPTLCALMSAACIGAYAQLVHATLRAGPLSGSESDNDGQRQFGNLFIEVPLSIALIAAICIALWTLLATIRSGKLSRAPWWTALVVQLLVWLCLYVWIMMLDFGTFS